MEIEINEIELKNLCFPDLKTCEVHKIKLIINDELMFHGKITGVSINREFDDTEDHSCKLVTDERNIPFFDDKQQKIITIKASRTQ